MSVQAVQAQLVLQAPHVLLVLVLVQAVQAQLVLHVLLVLVLVQLQVPLVSTLMLVQRS